MGLTILGVTLSDEQVKLGAIALGSAAILAVVAPLFDDEPPAEVRNDTRATLAEGKLERKAQRRDDQVARTLERITERRETLDDRYASLRDRRDEADAKVAVWKGRYEAGRKGAGDRYRAALATANRLKGQEDRLANRGDRLDELYQSVSSGRVSPKVVRINPSSGGLLAKAIAMSEKFHGSQSEVVAIEAKDRELSPYGVVLGRLDAVTYAPDPRSKRAGLPWEHESGDRGPWQPPAKSRPYLVADAANGHIHIVQGSSPMKLDPDVGIEG